MTSVCVRCVLGDAGFGVGDVVVGSLFLMEWL